MQETKICLKCGKQRPVRKFFKSTSKFHSDGKIPICRECIVDAVYDAENDCLNVEEFMSILRQIDKPFIPDILSTAERQYEDGISGKSNLNILPKEGRDRCNTIVGFYFQKLNSLQQYKNCTWKDSVTNEEMIQRNSKRRSDDPIYFLKGNDFEVTEEMIRLFGEGYTKKEYQEMQRLYEKCKLKYPNMSDENDELILQYVRYATKANIAVAMDNITDAEKWAKMASDAFKQLNSVDNQGTVSSFLEFFQKFEREKDVTRILPQFKYRPNDAPDFIIWCYINYCRRLEGKPEVPYEDVYKFYDDKVAEYVKQYGDPYGIFSDDPTLKNREKIKEFIKLPDDYYGDNHDG